MQIEPSGVYVDATFGGGGHSRLMLEQLGAQGKLFGFDQDQDAWENALDDERFALVQGNFRYLKRFMRLHGVKKLDGILADLGVSSHQFDEAQRGFSYRFQSNLDMRMNQEEELTAAKVLNTYDESYLQQLFSNYGEVRNAKTLAKAIVEARQVAAFITMSDFLSVVEPLIKGHRLRYLSQVFQALRIEVNDEMSALEDFLKDATALLRVGGRVVIIAYHSIEDRVVKQFLKTGNIEGQQQKDYYGNIFRPYKIITKKAIVPSEKEIEQNPRARSAKMRVGERLAFEETFDD